MTYKLSVGTILGAWTACSGTKYTFARTPALTKSGYLYYAYRDKDYVYGGEYGGTNVTAESYTGAVATYGKAIITYQKPGDYEAPVAQCDSSVEIGNTISINLSDNKGVTAWQVTTSGEIPTTGWTNISSTTSKTVTYTPTKVDSYNVYVKDEAGNIGVATFKGEDTTAPSTTAPTVSSTSNTITVTCNQADNLALANSGLNSSLTMYTLLASDGETVVKDWQTSNVFTGLTVSTTYKVQTSVTDNAGNTSESLMTTKATTAAPTGVTEIVTIPTAWTNGNVTVIITYPEISEYTNKTYKVGSGSEQTYTSSFTVSENTTVTAYLKDSIGNITASTTVTISNIDKVKPTVTVDNVRGRTVTLVLTDNESGVNGYAVTTTNTAPAASSFTAVTAGESVAVTTKVTAAGTYYAWAKDSAGNVSTATTYAQWTCTEIPIVITKQPEDVELTEGESTVVTVEATGSNIVYRWQISEDGGTTWNDITGETKNTLELNDTTLNMSGNKYRCILTNCYGDTISNAMTLTVNIKLVVGGLDLRKDTMTGAIYDVDIWTKSVIHVKLIPGVGGTTTYMSLAGSAQTVEETTENSVIRTSGVTVLRVKTARGSTEVTKDYIIKVDKDVPIGGTIALDGKQREDDTTIKLKASGFVDEHSGIAQYVWEYKSNKETAYRQGKIDKSGDRESYFTFDAEDNTSYVVRVVVYDNVGNSVTVTADKEFSLISSSVKMKPTIRFTDVDKIVINEESGNKEVRANIIFKSSSPLTKIVIDGNEIDILTITPKMIGKEYVYETTYVITSNGVYVARCEDSDGVTEKEEVAISAFNTPNVKYKVVESGIYKEIVFTSTVPVKILETTPSKYKTDVATDSGEYSFINKMLVTEDEIDINFMFVDEHGNESNTVNVKIEAVIGKSKFVRAVDDKTGNKYEPFDKMNVDTAYRLAQEMENKIATINSKVVSYYGTNNGQTDMFMSRARDVGATVYLMNASKVGTYNGKMIKDLGGNPTSEVATYGLQEIGTKQEYTSAYVKGATSNSLTTENTKYKDVITSVTTLRLYKGFAMADYPSASGSLDTGFVVRTGEKAYATQNGETNTNSSFRITLINK